MTRHRDELLTVHADDPAELTAAEAAEVEDRLARSPEARAEVAEARTVLARLRGLPAEGQEPAWADFQRSVRLAIAEAEAARARGVGGWLRRFWKPVAGLGLAVTAAAAILLGRPSTEPTERVVLDPEPGVDAGVQVTPPDPVPTPDELPLAFGPESDVDDDALDDVLVAFADEADDPLAAPDQGLVPDLTLDWVDDLDEEDLDAVDAWLATLEDET
jgi:hypothetical protein